MWEYAKSYKSDLVGETEGVRISCETDVSFLVSSDSIKGIDGSDLNVVELLESSLDLRLGGSLVDNEHHSVFVFHLLHGLFSGERS